MELKIEALEGLFTVCKVADYSAVDWLRPLCFVGKTDAENSLVCETAHVPANVIVREDGWRGVRVAGTLDFSLVGILARISAVLAEAKIGIFAVSTFDTDYVFMKEECFASALAALAQAGIGSRGTADKRENAGMGGSAVASCLRRRRDSTKNGAKQNPPGKQ